MVGQRRRVIQGSEMEIRDAVPADAQAACEVLRRSIVELCVADHRNDPAILERWLANKTPEIVASWIAQPGSSLLVAVEEKTILAVGAVSDTGEISLNYVSPDARFRGVSRAILRALETRAVARQRALHASQFRDGAPLLPCVRLRRRWPAAGQIRHDRQLSDVEKPDRRGRSRCGSPHQGRRRIAG